jgi:uncharacterized membrane protein
MTHISTTIHIEAPRDRVWAVVRDVEHWFEWTSTIISVRPLDPGPLAVGSRAIVRQPKLLPAQWQITELEEGRSFSWITRAPGVLVTARHSIEDAAGGSRATLALDFSGPLGPLCALLTRGLNERYLALEARGLKKRVETEVQAQAAGIRASEGSR